MTTLEPTLVRGEIVCRGMLAHDEAAYRAFASRFWGGGTLQAQTSYFNWLYQKNPNTRGPQLDLLLLLHNEKIVGAHHRMRIPWHVNGERCIVAALHDLAVLPEYRTQAMQKGLLAPGLQIMLAGLRGERHVGIFGMTELVEKIYQGMRLPTLHLSWLEKVNWPSTATQWIGSRLAGKAAPLRPPQPRALRRGNFQIARHLKPSHDELQEALSLVPECSSYPDWDLASYRWRFFDELGPQNVLLLARRDTQVRGRAVISFGVRKRLRIARLVDLVIHDEDCLPLLLEEMSAVCEEMKIAAALAVAPSPTVANALLLQGWRMRNQPLRTRWFAAQHDPPRDHWITGGAWDFGCDLRS